MKKNKKIIKSKCAITIKMKFRKLVNKKRSNHKKNKMKNKKIVKTYRIKKQANTNFLHRINKNSTKKAQIELR